MKPKIVFAIALLAVLSGCSAGKDNQESNTDTGRAIPAPALRVLHEDSEEEKEALSESFVGITNDGEIRNDLYAIEATGISTEPIRNSVETFLSSLSPEQISSCTFPIDDQEWRRWTNIDIAEYKRKGIGLPDLTEHQRELAFSILKVSLSPDGFTKVQDIMKMEGYLARLANEFENLGPDLYWFTFMGKPSETEPWGWQLDGHHLVINYFVLGDQVVITPTFMGSEPNYIEDGENAGTRTFEDEERLGLEFYNSLNESQKAKATLFDRKIYDHNQTESFRDNAIVPYAGIISTELDEQQLSSLKKLIGVYIGNIREGHSEIRMAEILGHIDETYFSWVGKINGDGPFYYRIQSPVVIIEFDHHKPVFLEGDLPTRKHVHTVVRTPNGNDYGKDLLKQHLEQHRH
ncbi:MAG: hypothetical protein CMO01_19285 [Thalassobius sp.]|nr:hypothetical protein [Thalassovita sp.]